MEEGEEECSRKCSKAYLPLLVMTISVPYLANDSQRSLASRVTLGSSFTPSSSSGGSGGTGGRGKPPAAAAAPPKKPRGKSPG